MSVQNHEKIDTGNTKSLDICWYKYQQYNMKKNPKYIFFKIKLNKNLSRFNMSYTRCHMSCHVLTATVTAIDPPPANSHTMYIGMVR